MRGGPCKTARRPRGSRLQRLRSRRSIGSAIGFAARELNPWLGVYSRSMMPAMACPWPMHMVAMP
jgi:hypothetical protein